MHLYIYILVWVCVCACVCVCARMRLRACVRAYVCACLRARVYACCVYVCFECVWVCVSATSLHTNTRTFVRVFESITYCKRIWIQQGRKILKQISFHFMFTINMPTQYLIRFWNMRQAWWLWYSHLVHHWRYSHMCQPWRWRWYIQSDYLISLSSSFPIVRGEVLPATFSPPHLIVFSTLLCLLSSSSSLPPLLPSSHLS